MKNIPNHIGIIPDGNRRFAKDWNFTLLDSYMHGADIAVNICRLAQRSGVNHISFFGTSNENVLCRPRHEIEALRKGVLHFCNEIISDSDYTFHLVGDIEGMKQTRTERLAFRRLQKLSKNHGKFVVHVDVNYSGEIRSELEPLFRAIKNHGLAKVRQKPDKFVLSANVPPVDLLIRTGGKNRISGFLPFQTLYSELYFRSELWGFFTPEMFTASLEWFAEQDRTKGA